MRIAIVEDDPRYRNGLATFFGHAGGYELVAAFGSADAALARAAEARGAGTDPPWQLLLMDLELPGTDGIEGTRMLKRAYPEGIIVVLTVFEEPAVILRAIAVGADGYLLKKTSAKEMLAQLDAIAAGGAPLTPEVARTVLELLRTSPTASAGDVQPTRLELTHREQDVLRCLVKGKSYKQAADVLEISIETVRGYVKAIYRKLQVHSVAEAVVRAVRDGLV